MLGWSDDIKTYIGMAWTRKAANRKEWFCHAEAYVLQWTDNDDDSHFFLWVHGPTEIT